MPSSDNAEADMIEVDTTTASPTPLQPSRKGKDKAKAPPANTGSIKQFQQADYAAICTWLSEEKNFNTMYGAGPKTVITGNMLKKQDAYNHLATFLVTNSKGRLKGLNGKQLRD